jgi:hypothetical protein
VISVTLARRYARALLDLARKQNEVARTEQELATVAQLFRRDPRARRFFETTSPEKGLFSKSARWRDAALRLPRPSAPAAPDHLVVIADIREAAEQQESPGHRGAAFRISESADPTKISSVALEERSSSRAK